MGQDTVSTTGLWALVLASAALMGSPGPSTVSVAAAGAAFGPRRSLGYAVGLVLGTCAVLLVVAAGVHAALLSAPALGPALTAASTAYVLHLAVRIARAPPLPQADPAAPAPSLPAGLLLAAANPKAWFAIAAVFAGASPGGSSPGAEALLKTAVLAAMVVLVHAAWLLAGAALSRALRRPAASRAINLALAAVLALTSLAAVLPR